MKKKELEKDSLHSQLLILKNNSGVIFNSRVIFQNQELRVELEL